MNKTQKRQLTNARRFHQKCSKLLNKLITTAPGSDRLNIGEGVSIPQDPTPIVNAQGLRKLTIKELEYIIIMRAMTEEGYNQDLSEALNNEYAERKLLLEKNLQP